MEDLTAKRIKVCKDMIKMFQDMMIEHQANIRHNTGKIEVERSLYKTAKAHYDEYTKMLKELEGERK
jgi:hypothetical protein